MNSVANGSTRTERPITSWSQRGRWVRQLFVVRLASLARMKARMSSAIVEQHGPLLLVEREPANLVTRS